MKLDIPTIALFFIIGLLVVAFHSTIPPQPAPQPGSLQWELDQPLPLPIGFGLIAIVLAMGAWLHSPRGMKSGCGGWLIVAGVFILVIAAAYKF